MQGRPKAIIAGFVCMPPSLDYLRLPSADISEGGPKRISELKPYRARNRKFESISLQRGVRCEPVSGGNSPSCVEKPRFSAGVRAGASGAVASSGLRACGRGPRAASGRSPSFIQQGPDLTLDASEIDGIAFAGQARVTVASKKLESHTLTSATRY
jgi:hypothetical protein